MCDRYFAATLAETYPNRFYMHAAQTDRLHNSTATATMPTIWDSLAAAGVSGKYYFSDVPFLALWGTKYLGISHPYADFLADCASGSLPAVSFVDPRFEDEASGTSGDDHPHADLRSGELFLNEIYHAVTTSPNWAKTLLVVNYDEWGGFFDHVVPGTAPDATPAAGTGQRGFRVPSLVVSPRARRGSVAHGTYDHTSVLKTIEWRFGLRALTPRDAGARNIAEVLDFASAPNTAAPAYTVPPFVADRLHPGRSAGRRGVGAAQTESRRRRVDAPVTISRNRTRLIAGLAVAAAAVLGAAAVALPSVTATVSAATTNSYLPVRSTSS
ncbi:hypothetical protein GCM10023068_44170 [Leifsonia shinshuensis]